MKTPWQGTIVGIWYDHHPHWVVDYGCYSVTLRCRGSLPAAVRAQLREIGQALKAIDPLSFQSTDEFQTLWRRFKARAARTANQKLDRSGQFWQNSQYDRWVRDETEYHRWIVYFRKNPVQAGLVREADDYPYWR